ncbi:MAG: hypothetical protein K6F99_02765, partial [Lachnospiraceae bacterium]|nr:hypothetical protein [Lachnospiraceae bacterium]
MKKMMFAIIFMIVASLGYSTLCYADTVAVPYGDSGTVMQTGPQNGGSYSRTDMVYLPGTDTTYDSIYSNGITDDRYFNVNGVQYTQITTSYGNTGMATVTV